MGNKESNILSAVRTKRLQQLHKDQISSRYLSASRTSSGCFPTREVRFSAPVASLGTRGVVLQGVHPWALPSTHRTPIAPSVGGGPTGGWACLPFSGCARPGPVN